MNLSGLASLETSVPLESKASTAPMVEAAEPADGWLVRNVFSIVEPTRGRCAIALALLVLIAFARAPYTRIPSALFVSDGFGYYVYLPSALIDRDLDLSNQVGRIPYEGSKQFFKVSPKTGFKTNQFPIGSALFWLPFFAVGDWAVLLLGSMGFSVQRNGFGYFYELPVYVGSFSYGLAGVYLMLRTLKMLYGRPIAIASVFGVLFATPLAYYCWFEPNMSHTVAMFAVSLWLWYLCRAYRRFDQRWSTWVVLGILLGLVALVRPYNGILGIVAVPVALVVCRKGQNWGCVLRSGLSRLTLCCLVAILTLAPQAAVWKILYGDWFVVPRGSGYETMLLRSESFQKYLSTVLVYSPLFSLSVLGLILSRPVFQHLAGRMGEDGVAGQNVPESAASRAPFTQTVAPWLLMVLIVISLIIVASRDWYLGTAFGQRRMVDWSIFFAIGLASLISIVGRSGFISRAVDWGIVGLSVVQCVMAAVYVGWPGLLPQYGILLSWLAH
jgi:hypothetical protein